MEKKLVRQRRARKIRAKIAELKISRLSVYRSNSHISAQIFSVCGTRVLVAASTMEPEVRQRLAKKADTDAAKYIGGLISERAKLIGIESVAFDRSGFHYHGRVKALAEAAREGGLKF
jgi:large subunit ribosomal protein L18